MPPRRLPWPESPRQLVVAVLGTNLVGAAPALFVETSTDWLSTTPAYFPPTLVFPVVWTLLFTLLGVALYLVWRAETPRRRPALAAFAGQFLLNLAWTPVFFGLQRPGLGVVVIVLLWGAIAVTLVLFDRIDRRSALLLVPYLLWVSFAAVLNLDIYLSL